MRRGIAAFAVLAGLSLALLAAAHATRGAPLWPGARFTGEERDRSLQRALLFLNRTASDPRTFAVWGHDLLGAFAGIAASAGNDALRRLASSIGREHAREWRRLHAVVPEDATADDLFELVSGDEACGRLGVPDRRFRTSLRRAAARFDAVQFLGFDPLREPPPADLPATCPRCGRENPRGAAICGSCASPLNWKSRYEVWLDALIVTYTGDREGIALGAAYRDVLRWAGAMRPYPVGDHDAFYAITHLIYTLNEYSLNQLPPDCFPDEYAYLLAALPRAIAARDADRLGESLDTLRAFGKSPSDPVLQPGIEYLLASQNPDGSWGDPHDTEVYRRYHTTWTAMDGLREYRWSGQRPCLEPQAAMAAGAR